MTEELGCSHSLLSQYNFEWSFYFLIQCCFNSIKWGLRSNKNSVIFVFGGHFFIVGIIFLRIDHHTEGSWHLLSMLFQFCICLKFFSNFFECIYFPHIITISSFITFFRCFFCSCSFGRTSGNTFSSKSFTFLKFIKIIFEIWSLSWMTLEYYGSLSINKHHMRNTIDFINFTTFWWCSPKMIYAGPFFTFNMRLKFCFILINR